MVQLAPFHDFSQITTFGRIFQIRCCSNKFFCSVRSLIPAKLKHKIFDMIKKSIFTLALVLPSFKAYDCPALNLKLFVSEELYSPNFAADYCYRQSENATLVAPDDLILDECVYQALMESKEYAETTPSMARALLGGKSVEGAAYQWLNGDLVGSGGSGYDNWKAKYTNLPNDECMVATAVQGTSIEPNFDADYGWYTVDCSIPQRVLCKDCADDYYYMQNCYKMWEIMRRMIIGLLPVKMSCMKIIILILT